MKRRAAGDVGRLAPEGNVLAVGKRWALGCWPDKPETKMPPAEKYAPRVFAPEKFALAFSACRLNFIKDKGRILLPL